ncbi:MAG: primosomal protein N', partial [Candidatus Omnitrophica bacterium]|nr:primosomal protein N' [Candidatus Omnitrophota bacterium]
ETLKGDVAVGKRVFVPFGGKKITGYVLDTPSVVDVGQLKEIIDVLDTEPLFSEADLNFFRWTADYYLYPLGKALAEILPGGINIRSQRWITAAAMGNAGTESDLSESQRQILKMLNAFPTGLGEERLKKELGREKAAGDIRALEAKGFLTAVETIRKPAVAPKIEKMVSLDPGLLQGLRLSDRQRRLVDFLVQAGPVSTDVIGKIFDDASVILRSIEKKGLLSVHTRDAWRRPEQDARIGMQGNDILPNRDQQAALHEIKSGMAAGRYAPYLLHGVTGSGKTEIYLQAIAEVLKGGGGVICLAPEIALTPQLFSRFLERFPDQEIALMHSGVSMSVRYDQWRRICKGAIHMVIGARSAVFAPVRNLKLIIVDEEHDPSYKQDDRMRYHARDLAVVKARQQAAVVILGTATPSVQSHFNSRQKRYGYLNLPQRVESRPLPVVEIVDMKAQHDEKGRQPVLSRSLIQALEEALHARKQSLLFLNRRGFNTFLFCPDCGHVFQCLNCSVSLNHHAAEGKLRCHYCDLSLDIPKQCPACHGIRIHSYGVGTEKLEADIKKAFPLARVARMDSDTTALGGAHARILQSLERFEIDILVGTQMITKGHDFPHVTLVGVVSADTTMNMPDFRAAEKTFQLLTQVAGRGGRGDFPGRVVIQTYNPGHYAIQRVKTHDVDGFYEDEMKIRQALFWPPFARLINIQMSSLNRERGRGGVMSIAALVRARCQEISAAGRIDVLGPAEAPLARIKGRHRWQLLLRGTESRTLHALIREVLAGAKPSGLEIKVDVDPMNFM